jgi:SAM-dependent methyltransferase
VVLVARDQLYRCPGEFRIVQCEGCRHAFVNPRPTRESIGQFYPTHYAPHRRDSNAEREVQSSEFRVPSSENEVPGEHKPHSGFRPRSWRWLRTLVLWWIDARAAPILNTRPSSLVPRPRALELGCARGAFLQQLRERGWGCIGIEPSPEAARRAAEGGFDVRVGTLESVVADDPRTFALGSFDAIFAWMVVEHLHDPVATLRLARELLKPGGTVSFSVPNYGCWERPLFGRMWHALDLPRHLQHFTAASLRRLLQASGFELVEQIHQRSVLNLTGSVGLCLRTRFPRWSLGERLIRWTDNPSALGLILLAPLARLLALVRQAGRLTVVARRADSRTA